MIKNLSEFKTQYNLMCEPAIKAIEQATDQYNSALKAFMIKHFCNEKDFNEWLQSTWLDSHYIFDCGHDYITETMILESMISELECGLYSKS